MPTVSAVISTFQRPDACERAVLSALGQDPAPIEVLVCDDGSADDTTASFSNFATSRTALSHLVSEGLARTEAGRGFTVAPGRTTMRSTRDSV